MISSRERRRRGRLTLTESAKTRADRLPGGLTPAEGRSPPWQAHGSPERFGALRREEATHVRMRCGRSPGPVLGAASQPGESLSPREIPPGRSLRSRFKSLHGGRCSSALTSIARPRFLELRK